MITAKMTPEQFDGLAERLRVEHGLEVSGTAGEVRKSGVTASYHFDGAELRVVVTKSPMFFSKEYCEGKLADALRVAGVPVG